MNNNSSDNNTGKTNCDNRARLASVIKYSREERNYSRAQAANICGTSTALYEQWEKGEVVPNNAQWARLSKMMAKRLAGYAQLYQLALNEEHMAKNHVNGTPLKVSLAEAANHHTAAKPQETQVQNNKDESRSARAKEAAKEMPAGSKTHESIRARQAYAWEIMTKDPHVSNADLFEKTREKFGVGISAGTLAKMRETLRKRGAATAAASLAPAPAPAPAAAEAPKAALPAQKTKSLETDLQTAVELIFAAVPNLRTFTVSVNDGGEVDVAYTIREVVVVETGGSLKVKR